MTARPPRPCEYGSDLYWLWAWSETLDEFPSRHKFGGSDWLLLKPTRGVQSAFMRYGTRYRAVIDEINAAARQFQEDRAQFLERPTRESKELVLESLDLLVKRVQQGWRIIWDGEQQIQASDEPTDLADEVEQLRWELSDAIDGLGEAVNDPTDAQPEASEAHKVSSMNEPRDRWAYEQKKAGKTHKEIRADVLSHPEWDSWDTDQAVGKAIRRFCERNSLTEPRRKK